MTQLVNCELCIHSVENNLHDIYEGDIVYGCSKHNMFLVPFWQGRVCDDFVSRADEKIPIFTRAKREH